MINETLSIESGLREIIALERIIHEPARTLIMAILYTADVDFLFLRRETGLTKGNLSSHLGKLEQAGYIAIEKAFVGKVTRTICRQTETGRQAVLTYHEQLHRAICPPAPIEALTKRCGDKLVENLIARAWNINMNKAYR